MLFVGGLALVEHSLPLLLQPADLLLQPALLLVQVPDGRLVGHLGGLQGANLTCEESNQNPQKSCFTAEAAVSSTYTSTGVVEQEQLSVNIPESISYLKVPLRKTCHS